MSIFVQCQVFKCSVINSKMSECVQSFEGVGIEVFKNCLFVVSEQVRFAYKKTAAGRLIGDCSIKNKFKWFCKYTK